MTSIEVDCWVCGKVIPRRIFHKHWEHSPDHPGRRPSKDLLPRVQCQDPSTSEHDPLIQQGIQVQPPMVPGVSPTQEQSLDDSAEAESFDVTERGYENAG
jgi:hypothetical protein